MNMPKTQFVRKCMLLFLNELPTLNKILSVVNNPDSGIVKGGSLELLQRKPHTEVIIIIINNLNKHFLH